MIKHVPPQMEPRTASEWFNFSTKLKQMMELLDGLDKRLTGAVFKQEPITRSVQLTDQDIFSINFDQFSSVEGSTLLYACASIVRYSYKKKK